MTKRNGERGTPPAADDGLSTRMRELILRFDAKDQREHTQPRDGAPAKGRRRGKKADSPRDG
jgi:hypothetical protein